MMANTVEESIHHAIRTGNFQRVRKVLLSNPTCANDFDDNFESPLHVLYAFSNCEYENHRANDKLSIMKLLIEYGADVNIQNTYFRTPLHLAIERQHVEGVKILLKKKADPNIRDDSNITALLKAVRVDFSSTKNDKIIKLLLTNGADPHLTDNKGDTVLDLALLSCNWNQLEILLNLGARVKNIFRTFLRRLRVSNIFHENHEKYEKLINTLLSHTTQMAERNPFSISNFGFCYEVPPKDACIRERISALLVSLRKEGIKISDSGSGDLKLHKAIRDKDLILVKSLLKNEDVNVNGRNFFHETPLHLVLTFFDNSYIFEEIARLLLHAGANWRARDLVDETPFYLAVNFKMYTIVKWILSKIARVNDTILNYRVINLPTLQILYTENDAALHELLVAICVDCELVIDRLLDEDYNIDDASKRCRRDVTIALVKAVEMNNCNIVKKLLEAGFRTNGRFPGHFLELMDATGDQISLLCLLREFNDRPTLMRLINKTVNLYHLNPNFDNSVNLLLFYYVIDKQVNRSTPDFMWLESSIQWNNSLTAKFSKCKHDLFQMNEEIVPGLSAFDVMTKRLDLFIRFLDHKYVYEACRKKIRKLQSLRELKYYDVALQYRLELALDINRYYNRAKQRFYDNFKDTYADINIIDLPILVTEEIFSYVNLRDLKKLSNS